MKMAITLADLEARGVTRLTIACDRCPRHGRDFDLVRLRLLLATDCPAYYTGRSTPLCGARFSALPSLFLT
jgi:hypothetical protein